MKKAWFNNKTVIITGASSGFGKLLAQKLVNNHNCKVIGIARTQSKLENLQLELGENFSYFAFDVSLKENWENLYETLDSSGVQIDILINNAGVLPPFKKFEKYSISDNHKIVSLKPLSLDPFIKGGSFL